MKILVRLILAVIMLIVCLSIVISIAYWIDKADSFPCLAICFLIFLTGLFYQITKEIIP